MRKFQLLMGAAVALTGAFVSQSPAAIIVPIVLGGSVTFEAEARDSEAGTSSQSGDSQASAGMFVDGLDKSAAGAGVGDFIQFNFSNAPNPALTYQLTYRYRHNQGAAFTMTGEAYSVTAGPTYALETTTLMPHTGGWQNAPLFSATSGTFSLGAADTGLRFETLDTNTTNGIVHNDQFTLTAVPEPATLGLLGLGSIGLLARRRRD